MNNKLKKISFYTLGCRLNQAETALIEESFIQKGYQIVNFGEDSDLCVINSCTVTDKGDSDCRKVVRKYKRFNPQGKVAVVGCYSQVAAEEVSKIPDVNLVVGNREKMMLADIVESTPIEDSPVIIRNKLGKQESFTIDVSNSRQHTTRANLKIQDGCDFFCTFCVIPFARGRAHSRKFDDLLREANELVQNGHRELVLTGINVGTYHYQDKTFLDVIKALEQIDDLKRIRISSIEPTTFDRDFFEYMASSPKLCNYLHLPLQSGSDTILQQMKRKYDTAQFESFVNMAMELVPDIMIGTDIIVGFPGETDELFEETLEFVNKLPLGYFHVFSYSDRSLAKASKFPDKIPQSVIKKRSAILRQLGKRKKQQAYEQFLGKTVQVLFEQQKKGKWLGHDDHYLLVEVESDLDLKNKILPIKITSVENERAKGKINE
ncbi:MAG: tRNA (N(6)-L-threonylcarbamoyladenosine(37)-C(2))-methylthiotransferase MtaB [Calditrichia bacterium]